MQIAFPGAPPLVGYALIAVGAVSLLCAILIWLAGRGGFLLWSVSDKLTLFEAANSADDRAPLMELLAQEADWQGGNPARFRASIHARLMMRDARESGWIAFFGRRGPNRDWVPVPRADLAEINLTQDLSSLRAENRESIKWHDVAVSRSDFEFYIKRIKGNQREGYKAALPRPLPDPIPLTTFLREAQKVGWRLVDPNSQILIFVKKVRAAAAKGTIAFFGVHIASRTTAALSAPPNQFQKTTGRYSNWTLSNSGFATIKVRSRVLVPTTPTRAPTPWAQIDWAILSICTLAGIAHWIGSIHRICRTMGRGLITRSGIRNRFLNCMRPLTSGSTGSRATCPWRTKSGTNITIGSSLSRAVACPRSSRPTHLITSSFRP